MNSISSQSAAVTKQNPAQGFLKYLAILGLVLTVFSLKLLLNLVVELESPFLLFFAGILISTWIGGLGGGILATILSALLSRYFYPVTNGIFLQVDPSHAVQLLLFIVEGVLLTVLSYRFRTHMVQTEKARLEAAILERQHVEAALKDSETKIRTALQNTPISVYTNDRDLRYTWIYSPQFGFTPDAMIGKRDEELLPLEAVYELIALKKQVLSTGAAAQRRIITTINNETFAFLVNVAPLGSPQGEIEGVTVTTIDVTETERAQAALRDSELQQRTLIRSLEIERGRLAAILENLPVGIWITDTNGRVLETNRYADAIWAGSAPLSETSEAYRGYRCWWSGTNREVLPEEQPLAQALADKTPILGVKFDIQRFDDTRGTILASAAPVIDQQGNLLGAVSISQDITEFKRTEEQLRESEARFRNMADHAPVMIWITDPDATCTYLGQSWYEFTGQTPETGLGFGWLAAVHPDDRSYAEQIFVNAHRNREPFRIEYRIRRKDGTFCWAIDSARPRFGPGDEFLGYIGSVIDITERKQAEEALRESEEKYRALFNSIDEGFCICEMLIDENGKPYDYRWIEVNGMFEQHTGLKDVIGKTALELVPNLEPYWVEIYGKVALTGEPVRFEQGSEVMGRWFDVFAFRVGNPDDHQFAILFVDITARRRTEEQLRQQREILSQIINTLPVMLTIYEPNTRVLYLNHEYERLTGWRMDDIKDLDLMTEIYPDPEYRDMVREYMQSLEPGWREFVMTTRNGAIIESAWANILLSDGRQVGIGIDLRERKQAERRAHLLQNLAAALSTAIMQEDVTQIIIQQGINRLDVAGGMLALLSKDKTALELVGSVGYSDEVIEKWQRVPLDHPTAPTAAAVRSQKPLWMSSSGERERVVLPTLELSPDEQHQAWAVLPFNISEHLIGVIGLGFNTPQKFDVAERAFLLTLTLYCAQALDRARLTAQTRELATVEERQRLARDLHDSVSQVLFASTSMAEGIPKIWEKDPARGRAYLQDIITLNRGAMAEMRKLLLELRPEAILRTSFAELLHHLTRAIQAQKDIEIELVVNFDDDDILPPEPHVAFYRIAQEALNNVIKHSQASHLSLQCVYRDTHFRLVIEDDGKGFDAKRTTMGLGMNTMRERATALGATLEIVSEVGNGTQLIIEWKPDSAAPSSCERAEA